MSDTMLLGILRMPFDLALSTPTARIQYHQRGLQAADEIEKLRAEIERLRAQMQEIRERLYLAAGHAAAAALLSEEAHRKALEGKP